MKKNLIRGAGVKALKSSFKWSWVAVCSVFGVKLVQKSSNFVDSLSKNITILMYSLTFIAILYVACCTMKKLTNQNKT